MRGDSIQSRHYVRIAVAYWPVQWELRLLRDPGGSLALTLVGVAAIVVLEVFGRRAALRWQVQPETESGDDSESPTVLNLSQPAHQLAM